MDVGRLLRYPTGNKEFRYMTKKHMQVREWVEAWGRAGEALDRVRREELRKFNYAEHQPVLDGMLDWACAHADPRTTSGLIEQQRIFSTIREKK